LRERYGDNPSTHPDFDPYLWMEAGSSGGPDKNRVYRLSNTTAENLCLARSVSTVGSSPSVSNTQSEEFIALKQQYQQLSTNYDELRQIVMEMRSKTDDDICVVCPDRKIQARAYLLFKQNKCTTHHSPR